VSVLQSDARGGDRRRDRDAAPIGVALSERRALSLLEGVRSDLSSLITEKGGGGEYVPSPPVNNPNLGAAWGTEWEPAFGFRDIVEMLPSLYALGFRPVNSRTRPTFHRRIVRVGGSKKPGSNRPPLPRRA